MIDKVIPSSKLVRSVWTVALGVALATILPAHVVHGQQMSSAQHKERPAEGEIHILPVQANVYMIVGAGGNITMQVGDAGVLLVNSGTAAMSENVLAAIRSLAGNSKAVHFIINTSDDADLVGGNEVIAKSGKTIAGFNVVGNIGASAGDQAGVISFQTVLDRMSAPTGKQSTYPEGAWPTDTYTLAQKKVWFNEEGIRVSHVPAAHTDGDSIVTFDRSDVISTGDIFDATSYPVIDLKRGGSLQGEIAALNGLVDQAIPADFTNGGSEDEFGTMIIPGHGHLCDFPDLVFYQEMVIVVRDRIQDMIKKGMTLEQVKAAKPTMDYDPIYGSDSGPWTTDMFVQAAYESLSRKP